VGYRGRADVNRAVSETRSPGWLSGGPASIVAVRDLSIRLEVPRRYSGRCERSCTGGRFGYGGEWRTLARKSALVRPGRRSPPFLNLVCAKRQATRDQPSLVSEALVGGVTHSLSTPFPLVGGGLAFQPHSVGLVGVYVLLFLGQLGAMTEDSHSGRVVRGSDQALVSDTGLPSSPRWVLVGNSRGR